MDEYQGPAEKLAKIGFKAAIGTDDLKLRRAELTRSPLNTVDGVKQRAERVDAIERRDGKGFLESGMTRPEV